MTTVRYGRLDSGLFVSLIPMWQAIQIQVELKLKAWEAKIMGHLHTYGSRIIINVVNQEIITEYM